MLESANRLPSRSEVRIKLLRAFLTLVSALSLQLGGESSSRELARRTAPSGSSSSEGKSAGIQSSTQRPRLTSFCAMTALWQKAVCGAM